MSRIPVRILGAVVTAALLTAPVAAARPALSATPDVPGRIAALEPARPLGGVVPAHPEGIDAAVGTWERLVSAGRSYAVYTPPGLLPGTAVPLVVVLHGCTQSARDIALGTGVNALADRQGFVALYPEQSTLDNVQRCWNWFHVGDQVRGFGEPAEIAAITDRVLRRPGTVTLDRSRVYVMGISAGGAMAGTLAATYPDIYAAVGIHSGLEYRAAGSLSTALLAMTNGGPNPQRQGQVAYAAMGPRARVVPAIVVQGKADHTVWPVNGDQAVRQWLTTSRLVSGAATGLDFALPNASRDGLAPGGLSYSVRTWNDGAGRPVVQYWTVNGLAHAWSGGAAAGSFTDPRGPSATGAMYDFFVQSAR